MSFPKIRHRCRRCGGKGRLYRDGEPYPAPVNDGLFQVLCEDCLEGTEQWCTAALAIRAWNLFNDPRSQEERGRP